MTNINVRLFVLTLQVAFASQLLRGHKKSLQEPEAAEPEIGVSG